MDRGEAGGEIDEVVSGLDLVSLLPVTLQLSYLVDREMVGPLPRPRAGASEGRSTYLVAEIG